MTYIYIRTHGDWLRGFAGATINKLHTQHPWGVKPALNDPVLLLAPVMTPIYIIIAEFPMDPIPFTLWRRKLYVCVCGF